MSRHASQESLTEAVEEEIEQEAVRAGELEGNEQGQDQVIQADQVAPAPPAPPEGEGQNQNPVDQVGQAPPVLPAPEEQHLLDQLPFPDNDQHQEEQDIIMANLANQVPAINEHSSVEEAFAALAVGVQILSNAQEVDAATKTAVRDAARHAAVITTRHKDAITSAEKIRPMTPLPTYTQAEQAQRNDNIEEIKTPGLAVFKGSSNKHECLSWLSRIMSTAKQHRLTDAATINLMKAKCSEEAFDSIEQDIRERNDLETIVVNLERKFAGVCLPDEARIKCNTMKRNGTEMLSVFGDRLNKMARIATRNILDEAERTRQVKDLVIGNMKRILPAATKHDLEERINSRAAAGKPELSLTKFMQEVDAIEQRRVERVAQFKDDYKKKRLKSRYGVRAVAQDTDPDPDESLLEDQSSDDSGDDGEVDFDAFYVSDADDSDGEATEAGSEAESDIAEDEIEYVLNAVKQQRKMGARGGRNKFATVKKAVKKVVDSRQNRYPVYRPPDGPPRLLSQCKINRSELPRLARVDREDCLHCGLRGHKAGTMKCQLKGHKMVDRACLKCQKGLHPSNQCPMIKGAKN